MNTYRYSAPVHPHKTPPDPHSIMDQLAEHLFEHGSMEQAMRHLHRHGVKEKFGESLEGFGDFAQQVRDRRQQLQEKHAIDPLLKELSRRIHALVRREMEALRERFAGEQERINEKAESFLEKASDVCEKLEDLHAGKHKFSEQGFSSLEKRFEKLFLQLHEFEAESKALRKEEARRLATLQHIPDTPSHALKKLEGYNPVDPSVGEELTSLGELAEKIGALERVQAQAGFSGGEPVELQQAVSLVERLLNMSRLESRLRKGVLSPADELFLEELLGSDAAVSLRSLTGLQSELMQAGYLEDHGDGLRLSPRAIRRIGFKALSGIFSGLGLDRLGGHQTVLKGAGEPDITATKRYRFGDPFNINVSRTLMNAALREAGRVPMSISPRDFEAYAETRTTDCSNVLMIDLSYTMSQDKKLQAAKKVGLALNSLIRARFPRDTLHIVGFATYARELTPEELPYLALNLGNPFTNMQDGFSLAEKLILRDRAKNRQILLITDGEPTAFCKDGDLYVDYPPTPEIFTETLKEVVRLTRKGIVINTFMLDKQPLLVEFVEHMTEANKGRAFFSTPQQLGEYLLVDYISRRRRLIN